MGLILAHPMNELAGSDDATDAIIGAAVVPQDGPKNWYAPASAAHFSARGLTAPQHLHLMQDVSTTAADAIGAMPYTAANGPAFRTTVSGWTRKGIAFDGTTSKQSLYAGAGSGPNLNTQSWAQLIYMDVQPTSAVASKHYLLFGVADPDTDQVTVIAPADATDTFVFRSENVNVGGVYDNEPSTVAVLIVFNRALGTTKVYTSTGDRLVGTYVGTINDGYKCIGSVPVAAGTPPPGTFTAMWSAMWTGAAAEISDAGAKAMFEALNIDPLWYVAVDGPAHNFLPLTTAEWGVLDVYQQKQVGRALVAPASAWGFQETVTPVLDKIGARDLTVVFATMNTAIGITGWTRKCLSFSAGGSHGQASLASGTAGQDASATSLLWVGLYTTLVATTAFRQIMMLGGTTTANELSLNIDTIANGSKLQAKDKLAVGNGAAAFVAATPMLIAARWNRTAGTFDVFTKDEKISVAYDGTVTVGITGFGGQIQNTPAFKLTHGFMYSGANAEQTDQQVRDMFTTLMRAAPAW